MRYLSSRPTLGTSEDSNPLTFYCFGPSKKPRQRDFFLLTLTKLGTTNWTRTSNTRIFNPLLYHWSYCGKTLGRMMGIEPTRRESQSLMLPLHHKLHYFIFIPRRRPIGNNTIFLASRLGLEPRMSLLENEVLPLHYRDINWPLWSTPMLTFPSIS